MAILLGTQSNGETLPVQVNELGQLVAKGIEGPPGPEGPPGVGQLPPGAFDGAYLGWENGELVWFGSPIPPPVSLPGFRPVIYTGSSGILEVKGVGFKPSLVWIKQRNGTNHHGLFHQAECYLVSNSTAKRFCNANSLQSLDDDGFTVRTEDFVGGSSSRQYVAWCWDAGDTTVTNNDGSIQSQVRSNGNFSVVTYTGSGSAATVGIGLSAAPKMIITKNISAAASWGVYHSAVGNSKLFELEKPRAALNSATAWDSTDPTSAVFSVGSYPDTNNASETYIAYCWAETPGQSDFGQYTGTSSRLSVETGFRPSFVMIKSTGTGNWFIFDNARGASEALYANDASEEVDTGAIEFLDNGFQLLYGLPGLNESGQTYIYAAFANPENAAFAQRQLRREVRQEERQQNETALR